VRDTSLLRRSQQEVHAAGIAGGVGAEVDDLRGAAAMDEARGARVAQALFGARAGAEAAMEAATPVRHRRLAAAVACAGVGAAARGGHVVAGRVAVLELAAALASSGMELRVLGCLLRLAAAALVGGLLGGVGLGEVLGRHLREGVEPVRPLPGPGAAAIALADQRKEPLQGKRAADHAVLGAQGEIADAGALHRAAPAGGVRAGIGRLGLGEIEEVAQLGHGALLDDMAGGDLVAEQLQDGLERAAILVALLADDIRLGLDRELVRHQAGMRKRLLLILRHRYLPAME
jgi:hypothetical protein